VKVKQLSISVSLWAKLIDDLKVRGKGKRESGAFLLGPLDSPGVTEYICYDDLDPHSLDTGIIVFHHIGFTPLWAHCLANKLTVYADVHTHPPGSTRQSWSDIDNPMIVEKGHIALIVPNYARNRSQMLQGVGIYEYLGDKKWKIHTGSPDYINLTKNNVYGTIRKLFQQAVAWYHRKK
jgi:proteasome lid subunit RPN8/RPN11